MEIEAGQKQYGVFDIELKGKQIGKLQQLSNQEIIFEMEVSLKIGDPISHCLVLTSKHLFLKALERADASSFCAGTSILCVSLSFQLKFQILYQQTVANSIPKIAPVFNKVGLSLFKSQHKQINFYSPFPARIALMRDYLNKFLNQRGFHNQFKPVSKLGKGNFATVYQVVRLEDGANLAVKAFSKANSYSTPNGRDSLMNEFQIMREISHKCSNLLNLQSIYESDNSIYVVMELLKGKTLLEVIKEKKGKFTLNQVSSIMEGLLKGLRCLSEHKIMHRDLKPENIMLRSLQAPFQPVIVDFGLATHCEKAPYLFYRCGTPGYVAPEIAKLSQNVQYDPVCDVFSLGCIFHALMTSYPLFPGTRYEEVYKKNKNMEFDLREEAIKKFNPFALNLLHNMLASKPEIRINAIEALKHQFFSSTSPISSIHKGFKKMEHEEMEDCVTSSST